MRKMKDSGIAWIGEIPEEWRIIKLRFLCDIMTGDKNTEDSDARGEYPFFTRSTKIKRISSYSFDGEAILMAGDGVGAGKTIHYVNGKFNFHQRVYNFHNFEKADSKFLYYYLQSNFIKVVEAGSAKSTVDSIRLPMIKNFYISCGRLEEQQKIAIFLDEKSNQINSITDKTTTQIEKLREYKQALITETVTKGLLKNVKMKDSGIKWIGKIPEHWEVRKMGFFGQLNSSGVDKKIREGQKIVKSVHYMDVYKNSQRNIRNQDSYLKVSASNIQLLNNTLDKNDVLFTNSSETPDDMAHSTVISEKLENTLYGYHLMRFRPNEEMEKEFIKYFFGNWYVRTWFSYRAVGMTRYGVSREDFKELKLFIPPLEQQKRISTYLDTKCNKIDKIISEKKALITKLEKYKKSLIFEAVTGKIDCSN